MNLLARLGGMLVAPRALLRHLSAGTGAHDGLVLLGLYALAVAVPALGLAVAELVALTSLTGLLRGVLPLLPWLIAAVALEWCLGPGRTHRAGLCMVPMLLVATLAHLLHIGGPPLVGPADAATLIGAAAALALAIAVRGAIPPLSTKPGAPDMSEQPGAPELPARTATIARFAGLALAGLVAASATVDAVRLARAWPTLAPLAPGEPLPAVSAPLLDGGALALADLPATPHLLVFWTTWCGVCRSELPMIRALVARYADRGLRVVLVNADQSADQAALAAVYRAHNLLDEIPVAVDAGPLRQALRVRMYPHFVLVDAAGRPVLTHQGAIGERTLATAIEATLAPGQSGP
jgi:thiol-disulfide isomerase/thioredoxin